MPARAPSRITRWLESAPNAVFALYAATAAFCTYFCMYAFRKPFVVGSYEGLQFLGTEIDLKTAFVISQILGYTVSKYIGIKVVSEHIRDNRAFWLLGLIGTAEAALFLFAIAPPNLKVVAIFFNGLPLGMVWGMVVAYLEGRRTSDFLLAALCCSFIIASGVVKDIGVTLMKDFGITEMWMPFAVGAIFLVPFALSTYLLHMIPAPTEEDKAIRSARDAMQKEDRRAFVRDLLGGMVMLLIVYFFLTAFRDFRDNYGIEIFAELGYADSSAIFTRTEVPVAFGVVLCMGALNLLKSNKWGLVGVFALMLTGSSLLGFGTFLLGSGAISGATWMILTGLGSYLTYVPYNSVLFERVMAHTRVAGTAVFAIYLADAVGYTGSIGLQLLKDIFFSEMSRLDFLQGYTYVMAAMGLILCVFAAIFFVRREGIGDRKDCPPRRALA